MRFSHCSILKPRTSGVLFVKERNLLKKLVSACELEELL
jgi:hypothetical protein